MGISLCQPFSKAGVILLTIPIMSLPPLPTLILFSLQVSHHLLGITFSVTERNTCLPCSRRRALATVGLIMCSPKVYRVSVSVDKNQDRHNGKRAHGPLPS